MKSKTVQAVTGPLCCSNGALVSRKECLTRDWNPYLWILYPIICGIWNIFGSVIWQNKNEAMKKYFSFSQKCRWRWSS